MLKVVLVTLYMAANGQVTAVEKIMDNMEDCKHLSYQSSFMFTLPPYVTSYSFCAEVPDAVLQQRG